jgi:hypothetical protein
MGICSSINTNNEFIVNTINTINDIDIAGTIDPSDTNNIELSDFLKLNDDKYKNGKYDNTNRKSKGITKNKTIKNKDIKIKQIKLIKERERKKTKKTKKTKKERKINDKRFLLICNRKKIISNNSNKCSVLLCSNKTLDNNYFCDKQKCSDIDNCHYKLVNINGNFEEVISEPCKYHEIHYETTQYFHNFYYHKINKNNNINENNKIYCSNKNCKGCTILQFINHIQNTIEKNIDPICLLCKSHNDKYSISDIYDYIDEKVYIELFKSITKKAINKKMLYYGNNLYICKKCNIGYNISYKSSSYKRYYICFHCEHKNYYNKTYIINNNSSKKLIINNKNINKNINKNNNNNNNNNEKILKDEFINEISSKIKKREFIHLLAKITKNKKINLEHVIKKIK